MAHAKPVPPTASAEGESAALQAQVIDASTVDQKDVTKDTTQSDASIAAAKKGPDAGMVNYLVSSAHIVRILLTDTNIARLQLRDTTRLLLDRTVLYNFNRFRHSKSIPTSESRSLISDRHSQS